MSDHKSEFKSDTKTDTSHEIPIKESKGALTPGIGDSVSDWNPNQKPLDGSPVLTAVPQRRPYAGQTGAKPKTVAQHNAEVMAMADARERGIRAGQD